MHVDVAQESFTGPLGLLLEVLEKRELDITAVSLAAVADDFLVRMENEDIPPSELADFLLIASRLIYMKSRELVPAVRAEDEDANADALTEQLRVYKEFVAAAERLEAQFMRNTLFVRPFVQRKRSVAFLPPTNVTSSLLADVYRTVLKRLEPFFALQHIALERVRSVEERIEELQQTIATRAQFAFRDVVRGATKKVDVVMSFLALLELLRRNIVRATQHAAWGEITIHRL